MSMILGGLAAGLGDGLVELAKQRREDFLNAQKRQQDLEDEDRRAGRSRSGRTGGTGGRTGGDDRFKPISRGLTGDIRQWGADNDLDEATIQRFITEVERVVGTEGMTENQAWNYVLTHAGRGDLEVRTPARMPWGEDTVETKPGEGPYDGTFNYPDSAPAAAPRVPEGLGAGASPEAQTDVPGLGTPRQAAPQVTRPQIDGPPAMPGAGRSGPPGAPPVGTIMDGYRFKGGDPADEKNWEPV
jgi:hypothetical protein